MTLPSARKKIALFLFLGVTFLSFNSPLVLADDDFDVDEHCRPEEISFEDLSLDQMDKCKKYLEGELASLSQAEQSLQREIAHMDNQIYLTSLEINETEAQIEAKEEELSELRTDITELQDRILTLGELLEEQKEVLQTRARESYKASRFNTFELVFGAPTLSRIIERIKYLHVLERKDQRLIRQMEGTQESCAAQKDLLEEKKDDVEEIKAQIEGHKQSLVAQRASLDQQRADKEHLLRVTQGKEAKYQEILDQLLAEKKALESIYFKGLTDGTEVEEGQPIARMGNTGAPCCSTGPHLHFEVRECDDEGNSCQTVNPEQYLEDEDLAYAGDEVREIDPDGDWPWPVDEPRITQEYGETFWTRAGLASYNFHTGIDMTGPEPGESVSVHAVDDGTMYSDSVACGSCAANYVAIDHGDGLWTIYFHVQ